MIKKLRKSLKIYIKIWLENSSCYFFLLFNKRCTSLYCFTLVYCKQIYGLDFFEKINSYNETKSIIVQHKYNNVEESITK